MEDVNNERRYTRHIHFTGPKDEVIKARMVYDYGKHSKIHLTILKMMIMALAVAP